MDEPGRCEHCGELSISRAALGGACPRCMLELGLTPVPGDDPLDRGLPAGDDGSLAPDDALTVGRYRILKVIGEGGMGTVYEAEQDHPRRTVALKIVKPGLATPALQRRFEQESQALGRLQHPGIAQIYEAGTTDAGLGPQPYFAMELIRGDTLDAYAAKHQLLTAARLEIVARIAEAVHHAHQRGVIHRDLKPGNILVDEHGQPKILDFGIARAIDSDARATSHTDVGQLVGTLSYMSPEQTLAQPLELDTRSDVYALGVILYELLAGRLPYTAPKTLPDMVRAIREEEPVRLGVVDRHYRGDVETIAATALEKDRTRRYASAAELAADIRRSLADEPIVARPPSAAYQLGKFARRHRTLVTSAAAVIVILVAAVAVSLWLAAVANIERDRAVAAQRQAQEGQARALRAESQARQNQDRARRAEEQARREKDLAVASQTQTLHALDRAVKAEARARSEESSRAAAERSALTERNAALEADGRARRENERASTVAEQARRERERAVWQKLARESGRLATANADHDVAALLARQAFLFSSRAPGPQDRTLVEDALQRAAAASPWSHGLLRPDNVDVRIAAISPRGDQLATNGPDGSIELWNLQRRSVPPRVLAGAPGLGPVLFAAFSPDGRWLATGGFSTGGGRGAALAAAPVKMWDLRNSGAPPALLHGHTREVQDGSFSADGRYLVTTDSQMVLLWDLRNIAAPTSSTPQQLQPVPGVPATFVSSLRFSPKGSLLAMGGGDGVRLWDIVARTPVTLLPASQGVLRLSFSADGTRLAAATRDGVRVWDLRRRETPQVLARGTQAFSVAWSRDGARVAAVSSTVVRLSPDGSALATGAFGAAAVQLWDLRTLQVRSLPIQQAQGLVMIAFSPDGTLLAAANGSELRLWRRSNLDAPLAVIRQPSQPRDVAAIALSSDNGRVAIGAEDVRVWDLRDLNAAPISLRGSPGIGVASLAFSPDGRLLAVGNGNAVTLWDVDEPGDAGVRLPGPAHSLAFSPDGARLAASALDDSLRVLPIGRAAADDLCTRVWRNLTPEEWRLYVGDDVPYERTCPALPAGSTGR